MANIQLIKLITGEDIVAKYEMTSENSVKLTNAVQISVVPSKAGAQILGFCPIRCTAKAKT